MAATSWSSTGTRRTRPATRSQAAGITPATPGYLDADGYLYLVDRVKDMIVTGGENVYSAEVENAIASHPAVLQVAVIGVPSDEWGEAVHAIVVLRDGADATEVEIIDYARESIAGYKVPKAVTFRADPVAAVGCDEGAQARAARPVSGKATTATSAEPRPERNGAIRALSARIAPNFGWLGGLCGGVRGR